MAYTYLLDLYNNIDLRILKLRHCIEENNPAPDDAFELEGRIELLLEFKNFLKENLNQKLPKRIRKKIEDSNP